MMKNPATPATYIKSIAIAKSNMSITIKKYKNDKSNHLGDDVQDQQLNL